MKIRIWGLPTDDSQTIRIVASLTELPEDAALARLYINLPELNDQKLYGETEVYTAGMAEISIVCPCDETPVHWSEFSAKLYDLDYQLEVVCALQPGLELQGRSRISISGFRPLGTQFVVDGRPVFIRGVMINEDKLSSPEQVVKDIKRRGLNCISIEGEHLTEELLNVADEEGVYIKVCGSLDISKWSSLEHPSLVMVGKAVGGYADSSVPWMEFAVRDRQDYSDAPDTKSDHREDVYGQDYPTLLTHVGEWRNGADRASEASEYLAQICCREEMEAALRTPQFGGFILQDDAAVLKLSPKLMREFSGDLVPLLMMKKYVWSSDEVLNVSVLIANYSDKNYYERVSLTATDELGQRYTKMSNRIRINRGSLVGIGEIEIPLDQFTPGQSIELQISVDDTEYRNHYNIWLFSDSISVKVPLHVHVTRRLDERTRNLLENGKKVVYIPKLNTLPYEPGWFSPLASQAAAQREKVASAGVCCDEEHQIFKHFPTEDIGDFQWWNLVHYSTPIAIPETLQSDSIVSMNDNGVFKSYIGECRVGNGKLIYSAIDLLIQLDRPEARQLYAGILSYVASKEFEPTAGISYEELEQLAEGK